MKKSTDLHWIVNTAVWHSLETYVNSCLRHNLSRWTLTTDNDVKTAAIVTKLERTSFDYVYKSSAQMGYTPRG